MTTPASPADRHLLRWTGYWVPTKYGQIIPIAGYLPQPTSALSDIPNSLPLNQVTHTVNVNLQEERAQGRVHARPLSERMCTVISDAGSYISDFFQRFVESISEMYTEDELAALNNWRARYPYGFY